MLIKKNMSQNSILDMWHILICNLIQRYIDLKKKNNNVIMQGVHVSIKW